MYIYIYIYIIQHYKLIQDTNLQDYKTNLPVNAIIRLHILGAEIARPRKHF